MPKIKDEVIGWKIHGFDIFTMKGVGFRIIQTLDIISNAHYGAKVVKYSCHLMLIQRPLWAYAHTPLCTLVTKYKFPLGPLGPIRKYELLIKF